MQIIVIAHNIRSTHNVGSILRTCDGLGVASVWLTGYTPYPALTGDTRLWHLRDKITKQIHKTALGAEQTVPVRQADDAGPVLAGLAHSGHQVVALEQSPGSVPITRFTPKTDKLALLLGEEVHGITPDLLAACDTILEIPMHGKKESFNVSVAAGIALFELAYPRI